MPDGPQITYLDPSRIQVNAHQPRTHFDPRSQEELTASIQAHGILQPLIVTEQADGSYMLVAGERRLRSAHVLNLKTVPAIVRALSEMERLELALIENLQRQDLNPMETARGYQRLLEEFGLTQEELGRRMGKPRSTVANTLRLLQLPSSIHLALESGRITEGHAKVLLGIKDPVQQEHVLKQLLEGGLTVRAVEAKIRHTTSASSSTPRDPQLVELEDLLERIFQTRVKVQRNAQGGGQVRIEFYSAEDLKAFIQRWQHSH
jgi:ParB family chromosome partitioning protein